MSGEPGRIIPRMVFAIEEEVGTVRYGTVIDIIRQGRVAAVAITREDDPTIGHVHLAEKGQPMPGVGERVRLVVGRHERGRCWRLEPIGPGEGGPSS